VLGIRPDVIRASLIIKQLKNALHSEFVFVWSGQHYSSNLKDVFFNELEVPAPNYELRLKSDSEPHFIGELIPAISRLIEKENPSICCFLGDTNTVLGSLACATLNVPIAHIEGCMRSYDWRMPEEKYRTVIDHLSDVIYAYLPSYKQQGLSEGLDPRNIIVTGNPIVDVLQHFYLSGRIRLTDSELSSLHANYKVSRDHFLLMTSHRRENVETYSSLKTIVRTAAATDYPVIFPASYRTQRSLKDFGIVLPDNVTVVDPLGYVEFLELLTSARYVLTDSGTVVEEAAVLGVPSIQMRSSTERPEVYECGASIKLDPHSVVTISDIAAKHELAEELRNRVWSHGLGAGDASQLIVNDLLNRLDGQMSLRGHQLQGSGKPFERNWQ